MSDSHYEWVGAALQNDLAPERFLFVFSPNPETLNLHREEMRSERGGLYREINSCGYFGAVLYTH